MGGAHVGGAHPGGAHPGGAHPGGAHYAAPGAVHRGYYAAPYSGYRSVGVGIGIGYGSGLYGPLNYGLGYSPFSYGGLSSGGIGYGALGYGVGYPGTYSSLGTPVLPGTYSSLGTPVLPGTYYPQYQSLPPLSTLEPMADPVPLPLPPAGGNGNGNTAPAGPTDQAKITVIASDGAKVSFDGIESEQNGTRHSFTTKPIPVGTEVRVNVKVDGASIALRVRGGESATVDMRK